MNCSGNGHAWTRGWTPGTAIANGEACDCGGTTWPDQSACANCEALRQSVTACQEAQQQAEREEGARLLTAEEVKVIRDFYEEAATDHHPTMMALSVCDSHEALRARLTRCQAELENERFTCGYLMDLAKKDHDDILARAEAAEARLLVQQGEIERRLTDDVIEDALQKAAEAGEAAFFTDFDRSARDAAHRATLRRVLLRAILLEPKPHV